MAKRVPFGQPHVWVAGLIVLALTAAGAAFRLIRLSEYAGVGLFHYELAQGVDALSVFAGRTRSLLCGEPRAGRDDRIPGRAGRLRHGAHSPRRSSADCPGQRVRRNRPVLAGVDALWTRRVRRRAGGAGNPLEGRLDSRRRRRVDGLVHRHCGTRTPGAKGKPAPSASHALHGAVMVRLASAPWAGRLGGG